MNNVDQLMKKFTQFFRSRRLAIFLLVLIIAVSLLGTIIPQQHIFSHTHFEEMKEQSVFLDYMDMIGFTSIFTSWLFFGIMFLFFINTSFCTYHIFRNALKKLSKNNNFRNRNSIINLGHSTSMTIKNSRDPHEKLVSAVKERRYKVTQDEARIYAEKHRFGVLGTPVFHLCILLVLTAILYGGVGRMEGRLQLVEGQTLTEQHQDYFYVFEGPMFNENHRNFDIRLERFYPNYLDPDGVYRGAASEVVIMKDGLAYKRDVVHSNHLLVHDDVTMFQNEYGFSLLFLLKDQAGDVVSGSYVNAEDDGSGRYLAVFPVSETDIMAQITLYPNSSRGILEEGYDIPQDPKVYLELFRDQEKIFDGVLGMNQMVLLGDTGFTLGFYDLKYWSIIATVIDYGTPFIFGGFYLALLSLSIMFFFSPRRIWAVFETGKDGNTVIYIGGRSDRYISSFGDEFDNIIKQIEEA